MTGRQPLRHETLDAIRSSIDTAPPAPGHIAAGRRSTFTSAITRFTFPGELHPHSRPNNPPPPLSHIHENRLFKPDPLVLAMVLGQGGEEATTPSPIKMLYYTSSTLSPPHLFIGGSTGLRARIYAVLKCRRGGKGLTDFHSLRRC